MINKDIEVDEKSVEKEIKKYENLVSTFKDSIFLNIHGTIYNFKTGAPTPYKSLDNSVDKFYYDGRIFCRRPAGTGLTVFDCLYYEHYVKLLGQRNYMNTLVQPITIEKVEEE